MDLFLSILSFIKLHFFYDLRSSVLTISALALTYFMNKLLVDKGDKPVKSVQNIIATVVPFSVLIILL